MGVELTIGERDTMLELLKYPNSVGIHPDEARWRDFSRTELSLRDERIRQLEELNRVLIAEVDTQCQREHALSDAYLRLRRLIGQRAFDTPHGPTGEQVWEVTETALRELIAEVDRMRPVIEAAHHWASGDPPVDRYQRLLWALRTYQASKPK